MKQKSIQTISKCWTSENDRENRPRELMKKEMKIMRRTVALFLSLLLGQLSFAQDYAPMVTIDGLVYKLNEAARTAMIANANRWIGELVIPEQVSYRGNTYIVDRIEWLAFDLCETLTKVKIPKTIVKIQHCAEQDPFKNPVRGCTSLESIEVTEENPSMCSVDGVLFSKDKTRLFCYPAGARRETYAVPEGVTWIGDNALSFNPYLVNVTMPNSVTFLSSGAFCNSKSLQSVVLSENISYIDAFTFEECESLHSLEIPESVSGFAESVFRWSPIKTLIIKGTFPQGLRYDTFYFMDDDVVIYVRLSEIEKFWKAFHGRVLPLESYYTGITDLPAVNHNRTSQVYNLQGRMAHHPAKGIYVKNGRVIMVK